MPAVDPAGVPTRHTVRRPGDPEDFDMRRITTGLLLAALAATPAARGDDGPTKLTPKVLGGAGDPVARVLLSPDGNTLAAQDRTGRVRLWATADGRTLGTVLSAGAPAGLAFFPDGKQLAVADPGGVTVWKVGEKSPRPGRRVKAPGAGEVAVSADGTRLAVAYVADVTVRSEWVKNPSYPEVGGFLTDQQPYIEVRHHTNHFAVGLWDLTSNEKLDAGRFGLVPPAALGFSADGKDVLAAQAGTLTALGVRTNLKARPLGTLDGRVAGDPLALARADGVTVTITGAQAVTGWVADDDGTPTKLFDLATPGNLHTVAHAGASADGTWVVTAHEPTEADVSRVLRVWDRSGAEPVMTAEVRAPHPAALTGLVVAADGSVAVSTAADGSIHLWRLPAAR
ncbi:MAG: hypothetical protein U0804_19795 [Gemmataceae bacterium]